MEELEDASLPASEDSPQALLISESTDSPQKGTERNPAQLPSPPLLPAPPPKAISKITKSVTGQSFPVRKDFPTPYSLFTYTAQYTLFFLSSFCKPVVVYCESGWLWL